MLRSPRLLCLLLTLLTLPLRAADADFLPGVKRIVFLGDSITNSGQYVDTFEAFLFTQFAERQFEVINVGLPSETVSGLSEEGHAGGGFPRPDLHERLDRVLEKARPELIFACYGMNDGIYKPYAEDRAKKFQDGMLRLRAKAAAAGAQVIHLTPPVFDSVPISGRVAPSGQESADAPFEGYDGVLGRYAAWLLGQRAAGWRVIDIHGPMKAEIAKQRERDIAFTFAKDGVHANAAGHALMANALIEALDPARAAKFRAWQSRAWPAEVKAGAFSELIRKRGRILSEAWLTYIGHTRPGMGKGLPPAEAKAKAAELEAQIRAFPFLK